MLVARRALEPLLDDLEAAAEAAARLAGEHRETVMAGRTLLQQALPIAFGLKAAGWLVGLDEARARLREVLDTRLAAQLGGAAGTLASLDTAGPEVVTLFAEELGLDEPVLAWHTIRTRPAELAGALGAAAGVIAKVGRDVVLMAQTEVGEVREGVPGRGGSSTLPHKRNPVAAISAVASAARAPGLVASLLSAMAHEHERAAGPWHAEWRPFCELLEAVGSAAAWLRDCLEHLEVDAERMRANLDLTHGALLAERVTTALAPMLGRGAAHELVTDAAQEAFASDRALGDVLAARSEVTAHVDRDELARLLDPAGYLGATDELISRALRAHAERGAKPA
jgi:3-carboxy-cis,cis-muconate cycloisomerase